jgi:hypothetical protein
VTSDTIRKFNRDTVWLATGVLGIVAFAALVLVIQEFQPKAKQAESALWANVGLERAGSAPAKVSGSDAKMPAGQGSGMDHAFTETPVVEIPSSQTEPGSPTPVLPSPPADRHGTQANQDSRISVHREDSARTGGPKARNARYKSSWASRTVDVKRRLIELWHLSLARMAQARTWTAFSNLHKWGSKKAAYTAETSR